MKFSLKRCGLRYVVILPVITDELYDTIFLEYGFFENVEVADTFQEG